MALWLVVVDNLRPPQGFVGIISREGKTQRLEGECHLLLDSLSQIETVPQCGETMLSGFLLGPCKHIATRIKQR